MPGAVDFYNAAKYIDGDASITKVGLFDEVFGYYLDKPYFWATPGHTTEIGYANMKTADDFIAGLKKVGISHCYLTNKYIKGTEDYDPWYQAAGIDGPPTPFAADYRAKKMEDQRSKWRVLFAEAIAAKKLTLVQRFSTTKFLYKVE